MTTHPPRALIVDDEPDILTLLGISLERMGIQSQPAADLGEARKALAAQRFDFCLTDLRLPDGDGLMLVHDIQQLQPGLPVAVITAHGDMQSAVQALKAGAYDFVNKPLDLDRLRGMVETALKMRPPTKDAGAERLLGDAPVMRELRQQIAKVSRSQAPVFIQGESGTGKEVIARLIHDIGPRADAPFVPINCGAIPSELIESELFGHRKGSFTGATADKQGLFQAAHGGTLFLDEVADLPLTVQVKLLRALQERSVRPVGATREEPVDARVISASHKNLAQRVQDGSFRQDLFYRLNVIQLNAPALREHPEDIPALAERILQTLAKRNRQPLHTLSSEAAKRLQAHDFPGNVRELENILERAVALGDGQVIRVDDLSFSHGPTIAPPPYPGTQDDDEASILQALEGHRWNRTKAAESLGMTLRQMRYRLKKMGIK